jgi:3-mercaptopyruvate sulfurtransferase SseA
LATNNFCNYCGSIGISNDSHIITYDYDDDFGLFSSPRVWWMFRCFGHEAISVLNGGFRKWLDAGLPVESGETKPIRSKYICQYNIIWQRILRLKSHCQPQCIVRPNLLGGHFNGGIIDVSVFNP